LINAACRPVLPATRDAITAQRIAELLVDHPTAKAA
jgi:hypothetical protein